MKLRLLTIFGLVFIVGLGATAMVGDARGFALGFLGSALNLYAIWLGIEIAGSPAPKTAADNVATLLRGLGALTCFPLVFLAMGPCHRLGRLAESCFLVGVGLVYSLAIGWGVVRTRRPDS